ncbi:polynucleotide kinase 3 phosphatase-domain-containing protein [Leucosporidium creatinivorum]|uniref:Polynucleotide kinase 3 phosphatase-domain-containing protein n=1 Tax=Leucosporidium creatinivorum TaxID=106004 RepID=A0A1Y2FXD2_9BASI|nr:polynucleotide kinase 3 phosphatase-domain-containing protein [Leucosporidium creatinivorum]
MSKRRLNESSSAPQQPPAKKLASIFAPRGSTPFKSRKLGPKQTCWHGVWGEPKGSSKVLALDLDGTVVVPKTGKKFPEDEFDWKWWDASVPGKLKQMHKDGYSLVLISNQAGKPKQQEAFFRKIPLLGAALDLPLQAFAALGYDQYRKPGTGMWDLFVEDFNEGVEVDLEQSIYVGDAAGRPLRTGHKEDHSDTDRKMALNVSLPFLTPEEFFFKEPNDPNWTLYGWDPKTHDHSLPLFLPTNIPLLPRPFSEFEALKPEVVVFVGSPASGKTSLFTKYFAPAGYVHVNQDTLKSRPKCLTAVRDAITSSQSCVVDNTSPKRAIRKEYLDLVRKEFPGTTIRILHFTAHKDLCVHNSLYRAATRGSQREVLPIIAFSSYFSNFEEPKDEEGFDSIQKINFKFEGSDEEKQRWQRWHDCFFQKPKNAGKGTGKGTR